MQKSVRCLLVAVLVLLSGFSCRKNDGVPPVDDSVRMPVLFGSNLLSNVSTRGAGALPEWNGTQSLYIYGLRRVDGKYVIPAGTDPYAEDDENAYLIRNVRAMSPSSGATGSIHVYRTGTEYFYYRESTYYDFYGYYTDDAAGAAPAPTETAGTITLDVTVDGSQDVMLAHTDRAADAAAATSTVDVERVYGAYAARRNVKPNLIFDHMLSRFNFRLKAGNAATAANVTVESLKVYSKSRGTLTIASNVETSPRGIVPDAAQEPVAMTLTGGSGAITQAGDIFGNPLMVMPGAETYEVELVIKQGDYTVNDGKVTQKMVIDFSKIKPSVPGGTTDTRAVSGHQYDVTIIVYGLEKVEIDVTMSSWDGDHGSFEIDPDEL